MKNVKLVLSVVAMADGEKESKVVYQTEKIFGGERVKASTEAQLVTELIGSASGGIAMKPGSVKKFKDRLVEAPRVEPESLGEKPDDLTPPAKPKAGKPPIKIPDKVSDEGATEEIPPPRLGGEKKIVLKRKKAAKKKLPRGRK